MEDIRRGSDITNRIMLDDDKNDDENSENENESPKHSPK